MRLIFYVVVGVIILTLLRSVFEAVGKAFSGGSPSPAPPSSSAPGGQAPQSLKKDPVCGTFVSMATAMQKTKGGETYYFCSAACRDKF
ncbi:MAG: YHS domain-containing protein [Acidobacteriia bacterium]|nr:YHS domain-containing protein [Terriglobia bacterium]